MAPKVSVIVPVYKAEAYLARCVESIAQQSFRDIEIILVDDGSPDNCGKIADNLSRKDSRIKVVHQQNAGSAEARRSGVKAAESPYLIFVDSDDELLPGAIEYLYNEITANSCDLVFGSFVRQCGNREFVVDNPVTGIMTGEDYLEQILLPDTICSSCCMNISKTDLWKDDIFPESILPSEDSLMMTKMTRYIKTAKIVNHPVYRYYQNSGSLSISNRLSNLESWKTYFKTLRADLRERDLLEKFERLLRLKEIDRIGFFLTDIDQTDEWIAAVKRYPSDGFPLKSRILQRLISYPRLKSWLITTNRRIKHLLGKDR